ncbi:uncharacterized protein LOC143981303 [Lithobates pipiens]
MSGVSAYKKMSKNDLTAECTERGIDVGGKNRDGLIHALHEFDIRAEQILGETGPERVSATPEPSGSEAASPDGHAETDTGLPRIVTSKPSPEQASIRLPGTRIDCPQMQETLQHLRETDPVVYLQFLERQAAAEREAAERRAEREERQAERETDRRHELEMARLQQQRQVQNLGSLEHRDDSLPVTPAAKFPVMEKDSDIDVYLLSFEKTCRQYHLPPAQWARYLTPGLRGKALDAYVELSEEQGGDYEALKAAIIQKFQLTPEVYRKRFRSLQKGPGDSYLDVVSRLRTTFRQWTKGLKADSFESLEDLMIEDQLLHICPTDVRQFVLERKPTSAKAAAELADTYIHSRVSDHRKAPPNGWKGGKSHMATPPLPTNQVPQWPEPAAPGAKAFVTDNRKCYNCGKSGHLRTQCPEQKKTTTPGHPASNPSAVLLVGGKPPGTNVNLQPVIVGQRTVTGFRDTGAEVTLVRPEVIEETDIIPEKYLSLTGVGGTCSHVPRAYVFLDWGAGSGMREVGVSEEIPTAVLLGSDLGTLVSYYAPAKSTQDAPTEPSGPTKVLFTDVGVISGQPVDGQREGEGGVEVQGPPSETGEEIPLLVKVPDVCSNVAERIKVKCDDDDDNDDDDDDNDGKDWERYLPHLLFAYREVPQESTGFSPFELLYGRRVRGPLDLIRETWEGKIADPEVSVVDYVLKFRDKMETLVEIVRENMTQAQTRQKEWYDRNARERTYDIGQKVYVLLPLRQNKLQAAWEGPYTITQRLNDVTYLVRLGEGSRRQKAIHVNMIKAHHERTAYVMPVCSRPEPEEADPLLDLLADTREVDSELLINSNLTPNQVPGLKQVLAVYGSRFTGKPGRTHLAVHQVDTGAHPPIKQSAYRVSLEVLADMKREVEEMLQLGVIQKSHSAWASPVVLVPKKDQTTRFCVDYRKLNAITTADAYPMPRIDELLDRLAAAHYITIMDLSRGYWQIPLAPEAREKSAFITPFGLFEFTVMPFGMKNAPATFQRVMNDLLEGLETFAVAYLDDIAVFSPTWEEHLVHLSQVLDQLTAANLTVKPSKCQIAMTDVQYLGHRDLCISGLLVGLSSQNSGRK